MIPVPHYLDVDTIFGDLGVNVYIRNTIFRKAPRSVVSGYGKRSININKVVATCAVLEPVLVSCVVLAAIM
jgi:hypothetical protein